MTDRFKQIEAAGLRAVALRYGAQEADGSHLYPCPACNEERRSRSDRRNGSVHYRDNAWTCGRCNAAGGPAYWIAYKLLGSVPKGSDGWRTVYEDAARAGFCDGYAEPGAPLPERAPLPAPPPPPPERSYPAEADVRRVTNACLPADDDAEIVAWLDTRLGPRVAGMVRVREAVLALRPSAPAAALPDWARRLRDGGYRAIFPLRDADGKVRSVRARRVVTAADDGPKSRTPTGFRAARLVYANPAGEDMLTGAGAPDRLIVVEGEPSFLAWCAAAPAGAAVIGISNGAWTPEHAARVPPEIPVLISTDRGDRDGTGDKYAKIVADTLPGRPIWRWRWDADLRAQPDTVVLGHGLDALRWSDAEQITDGKPPAAEEAEGTEDGSAADAAYAPRIGDAAEGLRRLGRLAEKLAELGAAEGTKPADRAAAVAGLLAATDDLGAAGLRHKAEARILIEKIATLPRCTGLRQALLSALKAAAESVQEREREARKAAREARKAAGTLALVPRAEAAPASGGALVPAGGGGGSGPPPVPTEVPDGGGPTPPDYNRLVPPGYEVDDAGVWRVEEDEDGGEERTRIALAPIYVAGITTDVHTQTQAVRLRWRDGRRWVEQTFPNSVISSTRSITSIPDSSGFPVSSVTAAGVVAYLEAARIHARNLGEGIDVSQVFGWQEIDGKLAGFLVGTRFIGPDGYEPPDEAPLAFDPQNDASLARRASAYRVEGTWDGWLDLYRSAARHPAVMLGLLGSFAAPILRFVPTQKSFFIDFAGETSQGKTTMLRVAASVWGRPDDGGTGVIHSWDTTAFGLENVAAIQTDLPFLLDDSKRASQEGLSKMVYTIAQGQGRTRGAKTRLQSSLTWRTVALSTGENPLASYGKDAGAAARVLSLWGSPLASAPDSGAQDAAELTIQALQHYGHAGPKLVQWLQNPANQANVMRWYAEFHARLQNESKTNAVASRACGYVALLSTTRRILIDGLGLPDYGDAPLALAWGAIMGAADAADRPRQAMRDVFDYAVAHQTAFFGRVSAEQMSGINRAPRWLGIWHRGAMARSDFVIGFLPAALRGHLDQAGYESDAVLRSWADRGWIVIDKQGKRQISARLDGDLVRIVGITPSGLAAIGVVPESAPEA